MSGIYGTVRPAVISDGDFEIFYHYRPTRSSESSDFPTFKRLSTSGLLTSAKMETGDTAAAYTQAIPGLYNLRLPLSDFGQVGFYTVYIKPKEYYGTISDVSVLLAYPDIRGIVINTDRFSGLDIANGSLEGYRVEYFDNDGNREDYTRIITSNNRCEPVYQYVTDTTSKSTRYQFTNNTATNLFFCTLTPSSSNSYKPNATPYIGEATKKIALVNTKFNPVCVEIEMTDHDLETISWMLEGDQIRDIDNSIITTYNPDKEIYHQANYYTLKNNLGKPLYEVKQKREYVDENQKYDNIVED